MFEGLLQPMHLLLILLILVVFFGPRKLPELGKGLGDGIREFRNAMSKANAQADQKQTQNTEPPKQVTQ